MTVDQCSIDAYHALGDKKKSQRDIILRTIFTQSGLSSREISRVTGLTRTSVCARLRELEDDGLICKAGRKVDRLTNVTVNYYEVVQ